ncbi:MAG TPA: hypothetical protein VKF62_06190, partial [Planctomycetota bacterium]|nr:hypothetical protein [Planctomycetota bacterium]
WAFAAFQAALNLAPEFVAANAGNPDAIAGALAEDARTFRLDIPPLSFFFLDVRTHRTLYTADRPRFTDRAWLRECLGWIAGLEGPGVLVLSQPLVEDPAGWFKRWAHTMVDVNLPDYAQDFAAVWQALFAARCDVLVLSGDIHWSRSYSIEQAGSSPTVHEVISSPLARVPEVLPGWVESVIVGKPDTEKPEGKVDWDGQSRRAYWSRRYATTRAPSYTTLTFAPMGGPVAALRVALTAWGAGGAEVRTDEFFLRRRS